MSNRFTSTCLLLSTLVFLPGCQLVYLNEDFDSYHDLSATSPYPFHDVQTYNAETGENRNDFKVLESGLVSLQARLDLIRRAKKNIEVEYFIFKPDLSGKMITHELIKASHRGVAIRVLIDKSTTSFVFNEYYGQALKDENIDVRYYNPAPIYAISTLNFRNHRKLLSADDEVAIVGGRNIGNDYFDLSDSYNFLDRDVEVRGSIVKTIRKTFDLFFEDDISERFEAPQPNSEHQREVEEFLLTSPEETRYRKKIEAIARPILTQKKSYICPVTTFTSDAPGGSFWSRFGDSYGDNYRFLRKTIFDKSMATKQSIVISSPYIINNRKSKDLMERMLKRNVDITLYTNSLSSTDATYVAARLYSSVYNLQKKGLNVYLHSSEWAHETATVSPEIAQARWGMHAKTQVYDGNEVMVGTYNIDNRSNFYNAEMAIFCKGNKELAQKVTEGIYRRAHRGYKIIAHKKAVNAQGEEVNVYGAGDPKTTKMRLMAIPAAIFEFLL